MSDEPIENDSPKNSWPFKASRQAAVLTTMHIVKEGYPVLLVTHDETDGMWQMLCGTTNDPEDGTLAALGQLIEWDPTLIQIADLPLGWKAWREKHGGAWHRAPKQPTDWRG